MNLIQNFCSDKYMYTSVTFCKFHWFIERDIASACLNASYPVRVLVCSRRSIVCIGKRVHEKGAGAGAASDSDLLESTASDISYAIPARRRLPARRLTNEDEH